MKIIACLALCALMLPLIPCRAEAAKLPRLRADGARIVDEYGQTVMLRGTNAGGWLVQEAWMTPTNAECQMEAFRILDARFGREAREELFKIYEDNYWTDKDFDNCKQMGMNVIRLPFAWWTILDDEGDVKPDAFERLDWFVNECAQRGIYVILDLHAAPGSQNGSDHSGDTRGANLWASDEHKKRTVKIWRAIATHYKDENAIAAYDFLNEPYGGSAQNATLPAQWDFYDELYRAVREVDPNHMITIESCWDPENLPAPSVYGWENVVYQYHFYRWGADDNYAQQKLFTGVKLSKLASSEHGVPVLVGEFTLFTNMKAWEYALNAYNEAGISWTTWTYRVTGASSWGLYNASNVKADIKTDSYERIANIWRACGAASPNVELITEVSKAITGEVIIPDNGAAPAPARTDNALMLNDFSSEAGVSALPGATVAIKDGIAYLTVSASRNPGSEQDGISIRFDEPIDAAAYEYLTFYMKDLQGNNTHYVTLSDKDGKTASAWTDASSVKNRWVRIDLPLSRLNGADISNISEISIGEWNSGKYAFDALFLSLGEYDLPKGWQPAE